MRHNWLIVLQPWKQQVESFFGIFVGGRTSEDLYILLFLHAKQFWRYHIFVNLKHTFHDYRQFCLQELIPAAVINTDHTRGVDGMNKQLDQCRETWLRTNWTSLLPVASNKLSRASHFSETAFPTMFYALIMILLTEKDRGVACYSEGERPNQKKKCHRSPSVSYTGIALSLKRRAISIFKVEPFQHWVMADF